MTTRIFLVGVDHLDDPITLKSIALGVKSAAGWLWTPSSEPIGGEGSHCAPEGWVLSTNGSVDGCATVDGGKDKHVCSVGDLLVVSDPVIKSTENCHSLIQTALLMTQTLWEWRFGSPPHVKNYNHLRCLLECKRSKDGLFNNLCWSDWTSTYKRVHLDMSLTPYTKINCIMD